MQDRPKPCPMVSRRRFIAGLGAAVATAACSGRSVTVYEQSTTTTTTATTTPTTAVSPTTTMPTPPPGEFGLADGRTLVIVEQGGGNDGLATVVPHADPRYFDLRGGLAVTDAIDLDGSVGLHPHLPDIADMYAKGNVAIIEGVGVADPDLSHFISMRRWWDGTDTPDHTGWIGRFLDGTVGYDELLAGITIGPGPSQAMLGGGSFVVNISDERGLAGDIPWWIDGRDEFMSAWAGFAPVDVPVAELTPLQRAITNTVEVQTTLEDRLAPLRASIEAGHLDRTYGLVDQLRLAAALIGGESAPRVIYVHGMGDFDTHEHQLERHGDLMTEFNAGVSEFWQTLHASGRADDVVLLTTSEFGRRPADVDGGTDHGTAGTLMVMGPAVAGGRHGEAPSLRRLDETENLVHTVDFRSVYASVLDGWLGTEHAPILRGEFETLPLFG